jgi:hypothetical protein
MPNQLGLIAFFDRCIEGVHINMEDHSRIALPFSLHQGGNAFLLSITGLQNNRYLPRRHFTSHLLLSKTLSVWRSNDESPEVICREVVQLVLAGGGCRSAAFVSVWLRHHSGRIACDLASHTEIEGMKLGERPG